MNDSQRALAGTVVLGRYRIVRELARGGMGMVYLGRVEGAAGFAKPVVIKRVLSQLDDEEGVRAQFVREARLLSDLQHPGIVGVIDFGQERDSYLMVLEYVHGYNLGHWLKYARETRGNLEWDFATFAMARVLGALHYAHSRAGPDGRARPIIHRDISPANVLVDLQGNVRLLDFGIARSSEEPDEFKTQEGIVKGKLPYIAPEMYQGVEASVASDIYAAGVSLYQLLSGKNPFSAKDMSTIVTRVLTHDPPPLASMRDDVPADLDVVLAQAMHKKPAERFGTAQEFASALTSLFERSESEILGDFRDAVLTDFSGDLPDRLHLPALATLDAAWRESGPDPTHEESLLISSKPPSSDRTSVVRVPADRLSEQTLQELTTGSGRAARSALEQAEAHRAAPLARPGISRRTIALSMLGAALIAGAVAAAVVVVGKRESSASAPQRYLLVERPSAAAAAAQAVGSADPTGSASGAAAAVGSAPAQPVETPKSHTAPGLAPMAPARSQTDAERLTAAFAKKQAAVQGCFTKSAGQLEGSPQVSLHFKVSGAGAILGASIAPAQLSGTTLGQCVLGVARSTQFPALGKDVAFSIPITARVVQR